MLVFNEITMHVARDDRKRQIRETVDNRELERVALHTIAIKIKRCVQKRRNRRNERTIGFAG